MIEGEWRHDSAPEIGTVVKGKTIEGVETEGGVEDWLVFKFTDKTELRIRYDYIYDWMVTNNE